MTDTAQQQSMIHWKAFGRAHPLWEPAVKEAVSGLYHSIRKKMDQQIGLFTPEWKKQMIKPEWVMRLGVEWPALSQRLDEACELVLQAKIYEYVAASAIALGEIKGFTAGVEQGPHPINYSDKDFNESHSIAGNFEDAVRYGLGWALKERGNTYLKKADAIYANILTVSDSIQPDLLSAYIVDFADSGAIRTVEKRAIETWKAIFHKGNESALYDNRYIYGSAVGAFLNERQAITQQVEEAAKPGGTVVKLQDGVRAEKLLKGTTWKPVGDITLAGNRPVKDAWQTDAALDTRNIRHRWIGVSRDDQGRATVWPLKKGLDIETVLHEELGATIQR